MTTNPNEYLNKELFEITTGILLGDANLQKPKSCKYYRLRFAQNSKRKDYVQWLFKKYKNSSAIYVDGLENTQKPLLRQSVINESTYLTKKHHKKEKVFWFQTRITSAFNKHADIFYYKSSQKKLCNDLTIFNKLLTPVVLAYWYMDDGSWPNKKSKSFILCTHGYELNEVNYLSDLLNKKFDLITKIRFNKNQPIIAISSKCYNNFRVLIYPILINIKSMKSKFPF